MKLVSLLTHFQPFLWSSPCEILILSLQTELNTGASCFLLFPESGFLCCVPALAISCDEQNEWCTEAGGDNGADSWFGKTGNCHRAHTGPPFCWDIAMWSWKHLVWILPTSDKLLNDRCSVGSPGSPGALITILRYAGRVCVLCKQREVIQTAVNFIKKPHFQVPGQAFLLMSGLSLSFIFASTLVNLARMSGAQLTFRLVFWLELQNEFTFRAHWIWPKLIWLIIQHYIYVY